MIKIIALILLLMPSVSYANPFFALMSGSVAEAASECSADGILFKWSMEDASDITSGTPAGCSMGDTTPTANDTITLDGALYFDGSYAADVADAGKYYSFTMSNEDIYDITNGFTVRIYPNITTFVDDARILQGSGDGTNYWYISMDNTDEVRVYWSGNGTGVGAVTDGLGLTTGIWPLIQVAFDQGQTATDIWIGVDLDRDGVWDYTQTEDDLTDWTAGTKAAADLRVGNGTASEADFHLDKMEILYGYNTTNPLFIASNDFEDTGTPTGWTVTGAGVSFDYTTSPAPLSGAESLAITTAWSVATLAFDSESYVSVKFEIYKTAAVPTSSSDIMYWRGSSADQGRIFLQSNGRFGVYHGTAVNYGSASTLATDDAINYIWADFTVGSGSDGTIDFYIAGTDSKPGSPAMQITTGTSTTAIDSIRFIRANSGLDLIVDDLLVHK